MLNILLLGFLQHPFFAKRTGVKILFKSKAFVPKQNRVIHQTFSFPKWSGLSIIIADNTKLAKDAIGIVAFMVVDNTFRSSTFNAKNTNSNRDFCVVMNIWYRPISEGPDYSDSIMLINILNI